MNTLLDRCFYLDKDFFLSSVFPRLILQSSIHRTWWWMYYKQPLLVTSIWLETLRLKCNQITAVFVRNALTKGAYYRKQGKCLLSAKFLEMICQKIVEPILENAYLGQWIFVDFVMSSVLEAVLANPPRPINWCIGSSVCLTVRYLSSIDKAYQQTY